MGDGWENLSNQSTGGKAGARDKSVYGKRGEKRKMIDLKRLKTETWFGYCIGTYDGKYRPTAYTIKRAAQKLMRNARTRNGDWFVYCCGKDGQAYKCAIAFVDGETTVYNLGTFKDLGQPIPPRFRPLPPIKKERIREVWALPIMRVKK